MHIDQNLIRRRQSSASAPAVLAVKLATTGTTSRWLDAFISGANLKKAEEDSLSTISRQLTP
jgi:hypothetical protein